MQRNLASSYSRENRRVGTLAHDVYLASPHPRVRLATPR